MRESSETRPVLKPLCRSIRRDAAAGSPRPEGAALTTGWEVVAKLSVLAIVIVTSRVVIYPYRYG